MVVASMIRSQLLYGSLNTLGVLLGSSLRSMSSVFVDDSTVGIRDQSVLVPLWAATCLPLLPTEVTELMFAAVETLVLRRQKSDLEKGFEAHRQVIW